MKIKRFGEKRTSQTGLLFSDHTFLNDCLYFLNKILNGLLSTKALEDGMFVQE